MTPNIPPTNITHKMLLLLTRLIYRRLDKTIEQFKSLSFCKVSYQLTWIFLFVLSRNQATVIFVVVKVSLVARSSIIVV